MVYFFFRLDVCNHQYRLNSEFICGLFDAVYWWDKDEFKRLPKYLVSDLMQILRK